MLVIYNLKAHPGVVVGAFPESGLIVCGIARTPEPFSMFPVPDVLFYIIPAITGQAQGVGNLMPEVQVKQTHYCF